MIGAVRVLMSSVPAVAHVLTLTPLARALTRRGHEVALVSGAETAPLLGPDVPLLDAGPTLAAMLAESGRRRPPGDEPPRRGVDAGIGRFFGGVRVELTVDEARAAAARFGPDLVVGEGLDGVGAVLAAEHGVAHVAVSLGPVCSREIDRGLRDHRRDHGFTAADSVLRLDPWPEALRPPGWEPPGPASAIRPEPGLAGPDPRPGVPDGEGPCVLLTLGTLFAAADALQPLLDALVAAGLRVVCALGPTVDPAALRVPDPRRAVVRAFGPLDGVLAEVDAVVCHGGAATLLSALRAGRPVVVLPLGADHFMNADGVRAAGVGHVVEEVDAAAVAGAARDVVTDPGPRAAARALAATLEAMPSPDAVAATLEGLAR